MRNKSTSSTRGRVKKGTECTLWKRLVRSLEHGNMPKVTRRKQNRKVHVNNDLNYENKDVLKKRPERNMAKC